MRWLLAVAILGSMPMAQTEPGSADSNGRQSRVQPHAGWAPRRDPNR